jgi:hypothetical protein
VTASTTANEWGGQVTADGLAYYFTSYESGDGTPVVVRRASRTEPFGPATALTELDSGNDESEQSPSADELELYFTSDRGAGICMYRASRASTTVPFGNITRMAALCTGIDVTGPYLSHDGLRLYYQRISTFPYGPILMSTRATRADLFEPGVTVIATLPQGFASLSADELTMYFEANDNHHQFVVTRPDRSAPFGTPIEMPGLGQESSPDDKFEDGSITADGLGFFFSSDRAGSIGGDDSWFVERSCL